METNTKNTSKSKSVKMLKIVSYIAAAFSVFSFIFAIQLWINTNCDLASGILHPAIYLAFISALGLVVADVANKYLN